MPASTRRAGGPADAGAVGHGPGGFLRETCPLLLPTASNHCNADRALMLAHLRASTFCAPWSGLKPPR
eukprot:5835914-Pyramimonas_sp.AAC.1